MKKLLLSTAAVAVLALAAPAYAAEDGGVELELGGYFKGYLGYLNQDEAANAADVRSVDWLQDSEIHFGGQTTLDNGLTVGAHFELNADRSEGDIEESYLYFEGDWGRVNAGAEDGAAFLLQVAAPSADANYDGVRQTINPFNYSPAVVGDASDYIFDTLDYAQDPSGYAEKLTYLSPVFAGFQAGLSYAPDVSAEIDSSGADALNQADGYGGFRTDNVAGQYGSVYEAALRYEGQFDQVGIIAGGGYSRVILEEDLFVTNAAGQSVNSGLDDVDAWNVGLNLKYMAFSFGGAYRSLSGMADNYDGDTWTLGADYTTGPFKFGVSYLNSSQDWGIAQSGGSDATSRFPGVVRTTDTDRYTGGVVYEYGPGMTFRGSVSYVENDLPKGLGDGINGTTVLFGTQVNF